MQYWRNQFKDNILHLKNNIYLKYELRNQDMKLKAIIYKGDSNVLNIFKV